MEQSTSHDADAVSAITVEVREVPLAIQGGITEGEPVVVDPRGIVVDVEPVTFTEDQVSQAVTVEIGQVVVVGSVARTVVQVGVHDTVEIAVDLELAAKASCDGSVPVQELVSGHVRIDQHVVGDAVGTHVVVVAGAAGTPDDVFSRSDHFARNRPRAVEAVVEAEQGGCTPDAGIIVTVAVEVEEDVLILEEEIFIDLAVTVVVEVVEEFGSTRIGVVSRVVAVAVGAGPTIVVVVTDFVGHPVTIVVETVGNLYGIGVDVVALFGAVTLVVGPTVTVEVEGFVDQGITVVVEGVPQFRGTRVGVVGRVVAVAVVGGVGVVVLIQIVVSHFDVDEWSSAVRLQTTKVAEQQRAIRRQVADDVLLISLFFEGRGTGVLTQVERAGTVQTEQIRVVVVVVERVDEVVSVGATDIVGHRTDTQPLQRAAVLGQVGFHGAVRFVDPQEVVPAIGIGIEVRHEVGVAG